MLTISLRKTDKGALWFGAGEELMAESTGSPRFGIPQRLNSLVGSFIKRSIIYDIYLLFTSPVI